MNSLKPFILLFLTLLVLPLFHLSAVTVFVAPGGSDAGNGTMEDPVGSLQKAQSLVNAGDTVYIRGGTYFITENDISRVEQNLFACVTFLDKSGQPGRRIHYWAYPGEQPVFDFSAVKPANQRVVGIWVEGDYIHIRGLEMTGVQVTILEHTESYCIYSWGNHNIFERISMHNNKGTGLRHRNGGGNLFLYCDAYCNHDDVSEDQKGSNCDGFGCHPKAGGTGNVFRGCRAWFNSDDGYDCIRSAEAITFDSCWAFYNGYTTEFASLGDGNGFKAGGYAYDEESKLPETIPMNTIRFCLAVRNKANGFYSNHHLNGNYWYNNSALRNGSNYNMVNRESRTSENINVDGYDHVLKNNLGHAARGEEVSWLNEELCILVTNYFDLDIPVTDDDFISLDEALLSAPRQSDGRLPVTDFMRLQPSSDLIDTGTDIGFPYMFDAPDPGAFEQDTKANGVGTIPGRLLTMYPNPAGEWLFIMKEHIASVKVADLSGRRYDLCMTGNRLDVSELGAGMYFIEVTTTDNDRLMGTFVKAVR
ncbi:MAG: DUF4990 domain-containing protein [Bacteroidales bacterium]|nr:DUF4990 domain-containing protein [Bacteroidales bacterium]